MESIALHSSGRWPRRPGALLLCALGSALLVAPLAAQAAPVSRAATRQHSSSVCDKVSPAAVSALIGYSVPAATTSVRNLPATKKNHGISAVVTTCTFGPQSSLAELLKDVTLTLEVTSKPLTATQIQQGIANASTPAAKATVKSYSGLGVPGVYFTETGAGITAEGISGVSGTRIFGASVEKSLATSKLASLAKLAATL
jgi:hypothetical protein